MKTITIKIEQDEASESPSPREWDNLAQCIFFGNNKYLGDEHDHSADDFNSWEEQEKYFRKKFSILLPVYMYSHSGETISTTPFSCPWDSGQIGWIGVTLETLRKEFGIMRLSPRRREEFKEILEGEIKVLDQYLQGDIYGYRIEEDGKEIDSCWGFYGDDAALQEAISIINPK